MLRPLWQFWLSLSCIHGTSHSLILYKFITYLKEYFRWKELNDFFFLWTPSWILNAKLVSFSVLIIMGLQTKFTSGLYAPPNIYGMVHAERNRIWIWCGNHRTTSSGNFAIRLNFVHHDRFDCVSLHPKTRKSSCMNVGGMPPAA